MIFVNPKSNILVNIGIILALKLILKMFSRGAKIDGQGRVQHTYSR
ncbi:MAG: hypothetical protein APG12_00460 [Candidatus Methanofastidiosum methylothiophilum]|uniref:Uncharacterized protein n=1 Tax=Candidatus Methanofastidiosum methylothiophilum TaxID=1705564 RepID=A0A150ITF0_9EURY|nr:MAG: hypothetical protein APG10_00385 [Candidatus Methanofastidiosum methylthiophilus]KYC48240.1 MAG: hypothetical protein APG11_00479 [Candidatus Methanofastidiosum methylthiophilus]KYC50897.1 MAG: hypothetical protein APG12_00460 [Candidatus Methanofastidiosum methylthiophilus]